MQERNPKLRLRVSYTSSDYREIGVRLKLRFWKVNYVGTQYGGSMFSMADPFYMLMLMERVCAWDKAATINDVVAKVDKIISIKKH